MNNTTNSSRYACVKPDGFIYMFRDGEIVQRPKRLYGGKIERELHAMNAVVGYIRVEPEEFDRMSVGAPLLVEKLNGENEVIPSDKVHAFYQAQVQ